jgi:hypothetical protein
LQSVLSHLGSDLAAPPADTSALHEAIIVARQ